MVRQSGITADAITTDVRRETVSQAVIAAVAEATGHDPLTLEPLYDVVDPDALNAIFAGPQQTDAELRFTMEGCEVMVSGDGAVDATPATDGNRAAAGRRK